MNTICDLTIEPSDVRELRRQIRRRGLQAVSLDLFDRESYLAERVGNRFAVMRRLLQRYGVPESMLDHVLHAFSRVMMEHLLLLDAAHRKLWLGMLPREAMETHWRECVGIGRTQPRSLAKVSFDPKHVQTLRPDLTEFECKCFLEYREIEIRTAMRRAGWAAIMRTVKDYRTQS